MSRKHLRPIGALLGVGLLAPSLAHEAEAAARAPLSTEFPSLTSAAFAAADTAPLRLAAPEQVDASVVRTKSGTEIEAKVYRPSKWYWPEDEAAKLTMTRDKTGAVAATGEVVLVVFDPGDGVSHIPTVEMFHAMGATVVAFENPLVGTREGSRITAEAGDRPSDVVHAMITWAAKTVASDGRINLYAAGPRASELALQVSASRTASLWSVMVDGASPTILAKVAPQLAEAGEGFEGLLVVGGDEEAVHALEPAGRMANVELDGASLGRIDDITALVRTSAYQRTLTSFLNSDVILPPKDCLVCGLTRTAKRTILRLEA